MLDEHIIWIPREAQLPDDGETVMIYRPGSDEPVWLGYFDSESDRWRDIEAWAVTGVTHWTRLPGGPKV